ncbi:MAG: molybdopterin biosynthesis protein [Thermoguttaceae bacterium]|nr:molybdopterin biosynthesis protein [Thermoguttaceae bacterium]MDW8038243.1 molybdopterin biosynthesis protein [Thermoguttaceae bacterium]
MSYGQEQFLEVVDRREAERRFLAALELRPLGQEEVPLEESLGRVLAQDVQAPLDVPSFDRSDFDGFAVQAADTYGADEQHPRRLLLVGEPIKPGQKPQEEIRPGQAMGIATGGMLPRGADAVVMIEHTDLDPCDPAALLIYRAVTPGSGVTFAGSDMAAGETVLRGGQLLTSRETGVLAAIGLNRVWVWRRPRVAIISTGDELIAPGEPMHPGKVYDSNSRILADAVRELGGQPLEMGRVPDQLEKLQERLAQALEVADVVLLSGGTSKGEGDLAYRAVRELTKPGIIVHGVALKPGKPLCLAVHGKKPVVVLPGFPTSAIFTFHEFVAPVLRAMAGLPTEERPTVQARVPVRIRSEIGRTEYVLVRLVPGAEGLSAYPMGKGSGSVSAFSTADGFIAIDQHEELVPAGSDVTVHLLAQGIRPADLVVIGSHCVGLDWLLGQLHRQGWQTKFLAVGSTAGLEAARQGQCDLAGVHLLDPATGQYNRPFLTPELELVPGYGRVQGVVFRPDDGRFAHQEDGRSAIQQALADPTCRMVNRNAGSGTRILIDRLLEGRQPPGYAVQAKSHNAVAAAVAQGRADWGVAIEPVARLYGLGFLPLEEEHYDFVIPRSRLDRPAVAAFRLLLADPPVRTQLRQMGFRLE